MTDEEWKIVVRKRHALKKVFGCVGVVFFYAIYLGFLGQEELSETIIEFSFIGTLTAWWIIDSM